MSARGHEVGAIDGVYRLIDEARGRLDAAAADEYEKAANSAHNACVAPYQKAYDAAYLLLVQGR